MNEPDFPASPNHLNSPPTGCYVDQCGKVWTKFVACLKAQHPDVTIDGVHTHVYGWTGSTGDSSDPSGIDACGRTSNFGNRWTGCLNKNLTGYWDNVHNCALADCDLTRSKPLLITEYGYLGGPNSATPESQATVSVVQRR